MIKVSRAAMMIAALVFLFVLFLSSVLETTDSFLVILLTGVVFLGIPHGALDIFLIYKMFASAKSRFKFLGLYVLAVLPMVAAWMIAPEMAFIFFVVYSCFHFAQSDMSKRFDGTLKTSVEFGARLLIPFCIPFGIQPDTSIELAKVIYDVQLLEQFTFVLWYLGHFAIILSVVYAVIGIGEWVFQKKEWQILSLEPLVLSILFYYLHPLYALGIYFCFVHSVKHMMNFFIAGIDVDLKSMLPYWLIPILSVPVLLVIFPSLTNALDESLLKWTIVVISAIALPHTLLIYAAKNLKLLP